MPDFWISLLDSDIKLINKVGVADDDELDEKPKRLIKTWALIQPYESEMRAKPGYGELIAKCIEAGLVGSTGDAGAAEGGEQHHGGAGEGEDDSEEGDEDDTTRIEHVFPNYETRYFKK